MLMRYKGEYAEQNVAVNTKIAEMKGIVGMTTSFSVLRLWTPFLWSDAGSANTLGFAEMLRILK